MSSIKITKGSIFFFPFLAFMVSVPGAMPAMELSPDMQEETAALDYTPIFDPLATLYTYDAAGNRIRRSLELVHIGHDSIPGTIVWSVGDEITGKTVVLTPNPSEGELTVDIIGYEQTDNCTVGIYDINGQIMTARSIQSATTEIEYPRQQNQTDIIYLKMNGESAAWRITDAE